MKFITITFTAGILISLHTSVMAGVFTPGLEIGAEGGATESFLETTDQMKYLFEPTSGLEKHIRPAFGISAHLTLGKYLGFTSGFGYRHYGQLTEPTTVYLQDDIFEHDFKSRANLNYITVPVLLKVGIRRPHISAFVRFGIEPSLLTSGDIAWIIDGREVSMGSSRMPSIEFRDWDIPLHVGGEIGTHFGKNGIFLIGEYHYGIKSVATGIPGNVFVRGYGATVQYRRVIF